MKKIIAALALATVAIGGTAASAQQDDTAVRYDDLDLSTKKGVKVLERRIDTAAKDVCGVTRSATRVISADTRDCVKTFKANAMNQFAAVIEQQRRGG